MTWSPAPLGTPAVRANRVARASERSHVDLDLLSCEPSCSRRDRDISVNSAGHG